MISIVKKYNTLAESNKVLINCDIAELTLEIIKYYYPNDYRFEKVILDVRDNLNKNKSLKDIVFNIWNIDTTNCIHLERVVNVFIAIPFFEIDYIIEGVITAVSQYKFAKAWSQCGDRVNATYKTKHILDDSRKHTEEKILEIINKY